MAIEVEENNFSFILNRHSKLSSAEYICATQFHNSKLLLATNMGKLLTVGKDSLEIEATFDNSSIS